MCERGYGQGCRSGCQSQQRQGAASSGDQIWRHSHRPLQLCALADVCAGSCVCSPHLSPELGGVEPEFVHLMGLGIGGRVGGGAVCEQGWRGVSQSAWGVLGSSMPHAPRVSLTSYVLCSAARSQNTCMQCPRLAGKRSARADSKGAQQRTMSQASPRGQANAPALASAGWGVCVCGGGSQR